MEIKWKPYALSDSCPAATARIKIPTDKLDQYHEYIVLLRYEHPDVRPTDKWLLSIRPLTGPVIWCKPYFTPDAAHEALVKWIHNKSKSKFKTWDKIRARRDWERNAAAHRELAGLLEKLGDV